MMVVKSWGNSWATSDRFHEAVLLPCLFGCNSGKDILQHYINCPWLFRIVSWLRPETSSDPLVRFGIKDPSHEGLLSVACTFAGYHSIKNCTSITSSITSNRTGSDFHREIAIQFADAFLAVARDVKLSAHTLNHFKRDMAEFFSPNSPIPMRFDNG